MESVYALTPPFIESSVPPVTSQMEPLNEKLCTTPEVENARDLVSVSHRRENGGPVKGREEPRD